MLPDAHRRGTAGHRAARRSRISAGCCSKLLTLQRADRDEQMLGTRRISKATSACGCVCAGQGRAVLHGPLRILGTAGDRPRREAFEPIGVLARALDNPPLNALLERCAPCTGNSVIYRQGAVRRVLRTLAAGHGVAMLIDQHMHSPDAIWVELLRAPGGDDLDAGGAGAPHRCAGRCRCSRCRCPAAVTGSSTNRRSSRPRVTAPTPSASSRSAAPTCSRCTCGGIRTCGCGCIAAGAMRPTPGRRRACSRRARSR